MSNQNGMMSLLCKNNSIRYVEKKFLKECQYLKDATIFKRLFNLDEKTPFGNYQMNTDSDGNFTILKDFYISIQNWDLLLHFLRYGFTLSYYEDSSYRKREFLEKTCHVANILGGIPSFDKFYAQHIKNHIVLYNPVTPEQDEKCLYIWKVSTPYAINKEENTNWSVTKKTNGSESNYYYFRKLKNVQDIQNN